MLERFELDPSKKARTYSKGNRQKVALVAAFASRAELYLLDEPTSGLDPLMEATFQDVVRELKGEGVTVLLSSHILAEAEALSDRISIIRAGRVVQSGSLAELRRLTRTTVSAETAVPASGLAAVPGVHHPQVQDGRVTFDVDSDHVDDAVRALAALGVRSLTAHPPTLEELFLRQYGEEVAR
jgi:ABC-2 type transport system ATP-binding protein